MANPTGLRFDIYERVHLPDQVAGIRELEEIELLPRVSMELQNEYVIIQGDLLLKGTYADVNDQGGKPIEHAIPVEITLPLNRIDNTEEIGVEIENFDVDVISARSLNISGVLFLSGLKLQNDGTAAEGAKETFEETAVQTAEDFVEAVSAQTADSTVEGFDAVMTADTANVDEIGEDYPDEVVFVHQVEQAPDEDSLDMRSFDGERQEEENVQLHQKQEQPLDLPQAELHADNGAKPAERKEEKPKEEEPKEEKPKEEKPKEEIPKEEKPKVTEKIKEKIKEKFLEKDKNKKEQTSAEQEENEQQENILPENMEEMANENIGEENPVSEFAEEQAENPAGEKKPKIAFSGKNEPSSLHKKPPQPAENSAEQKAQDAAQAGERDEFIGQTAAETVTSSDLKNLFLSKHSDEQRFKKVKMCIVQKEESLQTIAARYGLNPREIILYNKLESEALSEGQIIYIPK